MPFAHARLRAAADGRSAQFGIRIRHVMNLEHWQTYYAECGSYLTSLHTQLLAVMSLQGAVALGGLAAMDTGWQALGVGVAGALLEAMFAIFSWRLFVQCGEVCKLMAVMEVQQLHLPENLALKTHLMKSPLFTSRWMKVLILSLSTLFAILLLSAGFALRTGH